MAHTFTLAYEKEVSYNIDLMGANYGVISPGGYTPLAAGDGATSITETFTLRVTAATAALLQTAVQGLETFFRRARERSQSQAGQRYFVKLKPNGYTRTYQSEIFDGRVELPEAALAEDWANLELDVQIIWTRAPFWEDDTMRLCAFYNGNGSNVTQITVANCDDGSGVSPWKRNNYALIMDGVVTGDLPAPVQILITPWNAANDPAITNGQIDDIFISNYVAPDTLTLLTTDWMGFSEGETGAGDTSLATCSGGKYHAYTVAAGSVGYDFEINPATFFTQAAMHRIDDYVRVLLRARWNGTYKFQPYIKINGKKFKGAASILANAGTDFYLVDLGVMRMPPVAPLTYSYFNTALLGVSVIDTSGVGGTVDIDYIHAMPNRWGVRVQLLSSYSDYTHPLIFENCYGRVEAASIYYAGAPGDVIDSMAQVTGDLYLYPGAEKRQILQFGWRRANVGYPQDTISLQVYFRERRRTI